MPVVRTVSASSRCRCPIGFRTSKVNDSCEVLPGSTSSLVCRQNIIHSLITELCHTLHDTIIIVSRIWYVFRCTGCFGVFRDGVYSGISRGRVTSVLCPDQAETVPIHVVRSERDEWQVRWPDRA